MSAKYALEGIKNRRIKISLIPDLNDPFEIDNILLPTAEHRQKWRNFVQEYGRKSGVICFSRKWDNPLLWSHYAEKHRGICLGFDVLPCELAVNIQYRKSKLPFVLNLDHPTGGLGEEEMCQILVTKYLGWEYEDEMRVFALLEKSEPHPDEPNRQLYFADFGSELQLREVIVGVRSYVTKAEIDAVLQNQDVKIIKAKLASNSFRVIPNKKGFISYRQKPE